MGTRKDIRIKVLPCHHPHRGAIQIKLRRVVGRRRDGGITTPGTQHVSNNAAADRVITQVPSLLHGQVSLVEPQPAASGPRNLVL